MLSIWAIRDERLHDLISSNDEKEIENQNNKNTMKMNATAGYKVRSRNTL